MQVLGFIGPYHSEEHQARSAGAMVRLGGCTAALQQRLPATGRGQPGISRCEVCLGRKIFLSCSGSDSRYSVLLTINNNSS